MLYSVFGTLKLKRVDAETWASLIKVVHNELVYYPCCL